MALTTDWLRAHLGRGPMIAAGTRPAVTTFGAAYDERLTALPQVNPTSAHREASNHRRARHTRDLYLAYLAGEHGLEPGEDPVLVEVLTVKLMQGFERWLGQPGRGRHGNRGTTPIDLARTTIRQYLMELKTFALWCVRSAEPQLLAVNPLERFRLPRPPKITVEPYSDEEIAAFYRVIVERRQHWLRNTAIITLLCDTGLRETELLNLKKKDLKYSPRGGGSIVIVGKGDKERTVIFGRECERQIKQYLEGERPAGGWLFPSVDARYHLNESSLFDLVHRRWGPAAGIEGANVHKFRHTFATRFLARGGDIFTLQELLGHTTLEMVRRYAKVVNVRQLIGQPSNMDDFQAGEDRSGTIVPLGKRPPRKGPMLELEETDPLAEAAHAAGITATQLSKLRRAMERRNGHNASTVYPL